MLSRNREGTAGGSCCEAHSCGTQWDLLTPHSRSSSVGVSPQTGAKSQIRVPGLTVHVGCKEKEQGDQPGIRVRCHQPQPLLLCHAVPAETTIMIWRCGRAIPITV